MADETSTAHRYARFARFEAAGGSPLYQRLAEGVAADPELIALLDTLPPPKRQPNLLLAAVRSRHGVARDYAQFREWVLDDPERVLAVVRTRATQTNEAARVAAILPVLAAIEGPIALVEAGASAGLCLYPDRFRYDFGGHEIGPEDSPVRLRCQVEGPVPLPVRLPEVVWRAGLDTNPLDVRREEDLNWLRALVWPEQRDRRERLEAVARIAREEPPLLVAGDLREDLGGLLAQAPPAATLVLFHTSVLCYLSPGDRDRFSRAARGLDGVWISQEGSGVFPEIDEKLPVEPPAGRALSVLAVSGEPVAFSELHGGWVRWLG
ncbi:DUF2332 domain-containing protein [Amycolatopsis rhizosphaerae]|uniref:DUF2332 domain-containing protein n=1 Tax=Amycolatopsis rhizosphaerae TaxID=2053003 RepID=A0A558BFM6_9PSEU|nr:DUF2332 domain-containing protein [Amycolatopsis rhizosphaerae]TVT35303.1 DUF2332 domain-containing protein [Amycolatopsis rhizosphaerae]